MADYVIFIFFFKKKLSIFSKICFADKKELDSNALLIREAEQTFVSTPYVSLPKLSKSWAPLWIKSNLKIVLILVVAIVVIWKDSRKKNNSRLLNKWPGSLVGLVLNKVFRDEPKIQASSIRELRQDLFSKNVSSNWNL